ncbi:MAG TPA: hypothetical protein VHF87_01000 [Methylomirabilota bacterium]|jgi:hypothetical protein|nr:hypothetical protein [Methylomirabilota bacterium]
MSQFLDLVVTVLAGLSPLLLVGGLLALAERRDRRELARTARQARLSDALVEEVGAIVAPVVKRRLGRWRIRIAVPLGRPAVVARILGVLHRTLGRLGPERYEIVLAPQEAPLLAPGRRPAERRPRAA